MSKPRTQHQINVEYSNIATTMGDLLHRVIKFTGDNPFVGGEIDELHKKMNSLDRESDLLAKRAIKDEMVEGKDISSNVTKEKEPTHSEVVQ